MMGTCAIRPLTRVDRPAMFAIEAKCYDFPRTEEELVRLLLPPTCCALAAESDRRVVGFAIYYTPPARVETGLTHDVQFHIADLAVHPDHRRRGVGRQLMARITGHMLGHGVGRMSVHLRERNVGAQLFFRMMGFRHVRTIAGHHRDTGEDAYRLEYRLTRDPASVPDDCGRGRRSDIDT